MVITKTHILQTATGVPLPEVELKLLLKKYKGQKILFRLGEPHAEAEFLEINAATARHLDEFGQRWRKNTDKDSLKQNLYDLLDENGEGLLTYGNAVVVGVGKRRFFGLGKTHYEPLHAPYIFDEYSYDFLLPGKKIVGEETYTILQSIDPKHRVYKASINQKLEAVVKAYWKSKDYATNCFRREMAIQNGLLAQPKRHENILYMYEQLEGKIGNYIMYPFIQGGDLGRLLFKTEPLKPIQTKNIFSQICAGMSYLHQLDIIHRDIKLENILLDFIDPLSGSLELKVNPELLCSENYVRAKIFDFDISYCQEVKHLEAKGCAVGTATYMAPEVWEGEGPTPLVDIYAAGIVLYRLLTKHSPFFRKTEQEESIAHRRDPLPNPRQFNSEITKRQGAVLEKAVEKDPEWRYQSAQELQEAWLDTF